MRNFKVVLAGILMVSPVAGLRPSRALRLARTNLPKPGITNSPFFDLCALQFEPLREVIQDLGLSQPLTVRFTRSHIRSRLLAQYFFSKTHDLIPYMVENRYINTLFCSLKIGEFSENWPILSKKASEPL